MLMWAAAFSDDVRIQILQHLWPKEWLLSCTMLCRTSHDFLARPDIRESLVTSLSEDAFALTSPLWRLLRCAMASSAPCSLALLKPAFTVMGRPGGPAAGQCRGGRSRLLGRCFTVAAQLGRTRLVSLALECRADIEQRINGQSALDSAAQGGQLAIAATLLDARAAATQTAHGRWTPLMRAAQGGHTEMCKLLLGAGVDPDEWADRMTALDVAASLSHGPVVSVLEASSARRYMELPAHQRKAAVVKSSAALNVDPPPQAARGSLRSRARGRGVLWGSAYLPMQPSIRIPAGAESADSEEDDEETEL
mmetsp:Transcript_30592/g.68729  ORF Transcript_30592/g.68729 Transcript_30592/m.68729 type:complete len:308 (+) Transcript_30592:33-956(+)